MNDTSTSLASEGAARPSDPVCPPAIRTASIKLTSFEGALDRIDMEVDFDNGGVPNPNITAHNVIAYFAEKLEGGANLLATATRNADKPRLLLPVGVH